MSNVNELEDYLTQGLTEAPPDLSAIKNQMESFWAKIDSSHSTIPSNEESPYIS